MERATPVLGRLSGSLLAMAAMAPWPLLGILVMRSSFDTPSESILLFGGVTLFPLMILALFAVPDVVYSVLVLIVWLAAATLPWCWRWRRVRSWSGAVVLLGWQSVFSLIQALMGAMLIVGKSV